LDFGEKEIKLLNSAGKNLYLKAIHYVTISLNHTDITFQEKTLDSCLAILKQIEESEKQLLSKCVEDSPYILTTLFSKSLHDSSEKRLTKFLFDQTLVEKQKFPRDPILLGKTSKSISLQIPVFNPKVSKKLLIEDSSKQNIGKEYREI
jgi:hypothetical protein